MEAMACHIYSSLLPSELRSELKFDHSNNTNGGHTVRNTRCRRSMGSSCVKTHTSCQFRFIAQEHRPISHIGGSVRCRIPYITVVAVSLLRWRRRRWSDRWWPRRSWRPRGGRRRRGWCWWHRCHRWRGRLPAVPSIVFYSCIVKVATKVAAKAARLCRCTCAGDDIGIIHPIDQHRSQMDDAKEISSVEGYRPRIMATNTEFGRPKASSCKDSPGAEF